MKTMDTSNSLFRPGKDPLHLECSDGSVVNIRVTADEEDEFFVVGRLERLPDPALDPMQRGDLLKTQAIRTVVGILRMTGSGKEGFPGHRGEQRIVLFHSADPAGGEDMLPVEDGVVEQILRSLGFSGDQVTLDHKDSPMVFICEGVGVARQLSGMLHDKFQG